MCVAIWSLDDHPIYSFVLAHNRDELYSRKTIPVHWWTDHTGVLAGRDGAEGGTWLGLTSNGRLAFVTNVREPLTKERAVTRGKLPLNFLESTADPGSYVEALAAQAGSYNGFNLVVADLRTAQMACYSHSLSWGDRVASETPRGVQGVSNGLFPSPWPKVETGKQKLKELLRKYENEEIPDDVIVRELLQSKASYDDSVLPKTGVRLERERLLSPMFVSIDPQENHYGTMCMTVIAARKNGTVSVYEKYASEVATWSDHRFEFQMASPSPVAA